MCKILMGCITLATVVSMVGVSGADMSQAIKEKNKSMQQKEAAEKKSQKKKVDSKANIDKQKEMSNMQKEYEMKSNLIKSKQDMEKAAIKNVR